MSLTACKDCGSEVSKAAKACPKCGRPTAQTTPAAWGCLVLVVLVGGVWAFNQPAERATPAPIAAAQLTTPAEREAIESKAYARDDLKVTHFQWHRGGFGTALIADFTLQNSGDRDVQDIALECETLGESGTPVNMPSLRLFKIVKAGKSRRFEDVNFGYIPQQVDRVACTAVDLKFVE